MKKIYFSIIAILIFNIIHGQWITTIGGTDFEKPATILETPDSNYIVSGYSRSFFPGRADYYLVKLNQIGDTLWTKNYSIGESIIARSMDINDNGDIIIAGDKQSFNGACIIKINSTGDTVWTKIYNNNFSARSIFMTSDGGFIICGSIDDLNNMRQVYLIKYDSSGNTIWTNTIDGFDGSYGRCIKETYDGGYIIAGYTNDLVLGTVSSDYFLIKTNYLGDTLWTKTYENSQYDDYGFYVEQTLDTGYIVCGYSSAAIGNNTYRDIFLLKTNQNGDTLWSKKYGNLYGDVSYSCNQTNDGGFIIGGKTYSIINNNFQSDCYLIKTNNLGDTLWTKTYGGSSGESGYSIKQTSSGGYILAGSSESYSNSRDYFIINTDENGDTTNQSASNKTYVPDDNFEAYLEANGMGDGIANNDSVTTSNINSVTYLNISNQNIADVTGIEDFIGLTFLNCENNQISIMDVSMMDSLETLGCEGNQLSNINISQNVLLNSLNCHSNQLTNLDISQNNLLSFLKCHNNQITNLDLTNLISLETLACDGNQLSNLDLTQNTLLNWLNCHSNQLTSLDISQNPLITYLRCHNNQITNLDISMLDSLDWLLCHNNLITTLDVYQNSILRSLNCGSNQLTQLDFSNNSALESVRCNNNDLTSLDLRNGNNTFITELKAQQNDSLFCVSVDNSIYSDTAWLNPLNTNFNFDTIVSFSNSCSPCQPIYVTEIQSDCDSIVWNGTTYYTSGIFTDSLLTVDGCDSIVTLDVDITGANLAFTVAPVSLTAPPFIFPFNNTTPNIGNFDFTWNFGDGTVIPTNNANITHEYQYNGVYTVKLIAEDMVNNCGVDTLEKVNLINCSGGPSLSIEEAFNNLVLYPNPARYMINIDYGTEKDYSNHFVEIVNSIGQVVFTNMINSSKTQISVSNLGSKGLYFINIRNMSNEIIVTKHLIIN